MDQLRELKKQIEMAIILITHNFGIINGIADRVAAMFLAARSWNTAKRQQPSSP